MKKIKAKITECSLNLQQLNNGYNSNKIIPQSQLYIFSERERLPIMTTYNSKSNISIHTRGKGSLKTSQKMHLLSLLDNTPTMALHSKHITTPENLNTQRAPNFNDINKRQVIETLGHKYDSYKSIVFNEKRKGKIENKYISKMRTILPEKDMKFFIQLEKMRNVILKHIDWFSDIESQNMVYSMLTDLQEKFTEPYMKSKLNDLTEEKERLEKELNKCQDYM